MNFKIGGVFTAGIICCLAGIAQTTDYASRVKALYDGVNSKLKDPSTALYFETTDTIKRENLHSWLWPLCALIQGANEMEANQPGMHFMLSVEQAIGQYYTPTPSPPAYQDYVRAERASSRFYDDNQWIAIAYLDAYNRTHESKYLEKAMLIYRFMMNGLDSVTGGGIYWKEGDTTTKNTCSNGPGILVALQLYKITRQTTYLATAESLYSWTNRNLQSPAGLYYDNIKTKSKEIAKALYTYNTGTMLEANVLFFEIKKDSNFLKEAQRIAAAGKAQFFVHNRLPNEYWFNAVLLRGYEALYKKDNNKEWLRFFETDADAIWATERNADNLLGRKTARRLIDQGAMIEIYARLGRLLKR